MPACSWVLKVQENSVQPRCSLCLCGEFLCHYLTTETQRTQRLHREDSNCDNEPLIPLFERSSLMDEFDQYRAAMNEKLLGSNHLGIKRFFALDTQAYEDGALDKRTKELMGLVASAVLRCDDCVTYHIKQCAAIGINREEFLDAFNVALVVGGSITIPHLRRAIDRVDELLEPHDEKSE